MPTNILRSRASSAAKPKPSAHQDAAGPRYAVIVSADIRIRIALHATPTADRIWAALPLHGTAERWGESVHMETPLETGRERGAKLLGAIGEIYFWIDEDRILIPFGRTPISRKGEIRLPAPCNVWAHALDDSVALAAVAAGARIAIEPE